MKNKYGLAVVELQKIFERDTKCVYCHKNMLEHSTRNPRCDWYSIEHLNYKPPWNNHETVAICCWSCNSSRGNKKIEVWFKTEYCLTRNINKLTVAEVVKNYIQNVESKE